MTVICTHRALEGGSSLVGLKGRVSQAPPCELCLRAEMETPKELRCAVKTSRFTGRGCSQGGCLSLDLHPFCTLIVSKIPQV